MPSNYLRLSTMLVTGIILAPNSLAIPAVQDLTDLRAIVNSAANTIGSKTNSSRNWGWGFPGSNSGEMGTADLINNITMAILHAKYSLDTNKTYWLADDRNSIPLNNLTLPLTSSIPLPTSLPTITPPSSPQLPLPPEPSSAPLSAPYTSYITSVPNLSSSLIALGRTWHAEMNAPVHTAIDGLQEAINEFSATMLQVELIDGAAVVRTIRASSSLEDAQQAWGRFLNLPGRAGDSDSESGSGGISRPVVRRDHSSKLVWTLVGGKRYRSHRELWGRGGAKNVMQKAGQTMWPRRFVA